MVISENVYEFDKNALDLKNFHEFEKLIVNFKETLSF